MRGVDTECKLELSPVLGVSEEGEEVAGDACAAGTGPGEIAEVVKC